MGGWLPILGEFTPVSFKGDGAEPKRQVEYRACGLARTSEARRRPMTNPETPRHVEIKDEGDHTVAEAEVTTAHGPEGTVRTSMHARDAYVRPGYRASLVDAVMDLPEVQASDRVEAAIPYGDAESLERLRERTDDAQARAAGATTLFDANIRPGSGPADDQAAGEQPADGQPHGEA
jgi:hypothetical protein